MSEETTISEATEATEAEAPEVEYNPAEASYDDNSRVDDAKVILETLLPDWQKSVVQGVIEFGRFTNASKRLAYHRAEGRSHVIRENGFPDWQADTEATKAMTIAAESAALAKLSKASRKTFSDSVRQQVRRVALLPTIVGWILSHEVNFGDELKVWGEDRDSVLSSPSDALKQRVRAHYAAAGLKLEHPSFREKLANTSPGPEQGDPENPLEGLSKALEGLGQITPRYGVAGLLSAASSVSRQLMDGKINDIEGRPEIIAQLLRVATIAQETASAIDPSMDGKYDDAALSAAYFDPKADKIEG